MSKELVKAYILSGNPRVTKTFEDPGTLTIVGVVRNDCNKRGMSRLKIRVNDSSMDTLITLSEDQNEEAIDNTYDISRSRINLSVIGEAVTIKVLFTPALPGKKKIKDNNGNQILAIPHGCIDPATNSGDFTKRVEGNYPIVDKTRYILDILRKGSSAMIGPRRSGKTFIISTIHAIFANGAHWWRSNCGDTAICRQGENDDAVYVGKYEFDVHPVLRLDFSDAKSVLDLLEQISRQLLGLCEKHLPMSDYEQLEQESRRYVGYIAERYRETIECYMNFIEKAISEVARNTKRGVVVLIDEYDSPLTSLIQELIQQKEEKKAKIEGANISKTPFSQNTQDDLDEDQKVREMRKFYDILFITFKKLRQAQSGSHIIGLHFTYVTGTLPLEHLEDITSLRLLGGYDLLLGLTEKELLGEPMYRNHILKVGEQELRKSVCKVASSMLTKGSDISAKRTTEDPSTNNPS